MKRHAPATGRNREPIAAVLTEELPSAGLVLEVASGTGEHAVHFARTFPHLQWQPSDPDPAARDSISTWREDEGLANLLAPLALNAADSGASPEKVAEFGSHVPMGRPAQPEELAPAYVFLASNADSSYITGTVLHVMGGETAGG